MRGPLADENLGAGAVVAVEVRGRDADELCGVAVVVHVEHVGAAALHEFVGMVATDAGDDLQVGITRLDGVVKLGVATVVGVGLVEEIFVADLDVAKRERFRMAVRGAAGAPLGGDGADDVFDLVEGFLNEGLELGAGLDVFASQRVAGVEAEHGLGAHVFAPDQKLHQTHAVGGAVAPGAFMAGTFVDGADGLPPFEALVDGESLEVVAAGEAQEFGAEVHQHLHDVLAEAVRAVFPGRREQRDEAEPDRARPVLRDLKTRLRGGRDFTGLERHFELLPFRRQSREGFRGKDLASVVTHDGHRERAGEPGFRPRPQRGAVTGLGMHGDAPVAGVRDTRRLLLRRPVDREPQAGRELVVEGIRGVERDGRDRRIVRHHRPMHRRVGVVAERTVLNQFRVETAIVGMVDLLGHQAVETRAHVPGRTGGVNREAGTGDQSGGGGQKECEGADCIHGDFRKGGAHCDKAARGFHCRTGAH